MLHVERAPRRSGAPLSAARQLPQRRWRRPAPRRLATPQPRELLVEHLRGRRGCRPRRARGGRAGCRRRCGDRAVADRGAERGVNQNVLPRPGSLSTPIAPAHQLDELLGDREARGRCRRSGASSSRRPARTAGTAAPARPAAMPMPVSVTSKRRTEAALVARPTRLTRTDDAALVGELDRVADEVQQDLPQPPGIASTTAGTSALDRAAPAPGPWTGRARPAARGRPRPAVAQVEVDGLELEPARLDLREVEDVVDDGEQRLARAAHRLGVLALLRRRAACRAAARSCR